MTTDPPATAEDRERLLGKMQRLGIRRAADLRELHTFVTAALEAGVSEAEAARTSRLSRDTVRRLNGKTR